MQHWKKKWLWRFFLSPEKLFREKNKTFKAAFEKNMERSFLCSIWKRRIFLSVLWENSLRIKNTAFEEKKDYENHFWTHRKKHWGLEKTLRIKKHFNASFEKKDCEDSFWTLRKYSDCVCKGTGRFALR